jgi:ABC-type protease/lipase transport system fused ATPase/permease subunit
MLIKKICLDKPYFFFFLIIIYNFHHILHLKIIIIIKIYDATILTIKKSTA